MDKLRINQFHITDVKALSIDDTTITSTPAELNAVKSINVIANTRYIQAMIFDPNTAVTTDDKKVFIHLPFAGTLTGVHALVKDVSDAVELITIDINKNDVSILSTLLTIDKDEKGSDTATTPAVISDSTIEANDWYTIDVDLAGANAKGLTVTCTVVAT